MSSAWVRGIAAILQGFAVEAATAIPAAPTVSQRAEIGGLCGLAFCRDFHFWHLTMHV